MRADAKQLALMFVAGVLAQIAATWVMNNVRSIERAVR